MATEYSLLTCLGRDGLAVTMTIASPCVVTLNAHGMPDGHPIRFITTGALPTGLALNTTYYVKSPAANTFNVSATNGGAAINTSGTQSGTHKAIGEYWATLPATDPGNGGNYRERYGTAGSERVYATMSAASTGINGLTSDYGKDMFLEINDKFDDRSTISGGSFSSKWRSLTIWSRVFGMRSAAYHSGIVGAGYVLAPTGSTTISLISANAKTRFDGLECRNAATSGAYAAMRNTAPLAIVCNNILSGNYGYQDTGTVSYVYNNIAIGCATYGFLLLAYSGSGSLFCNNIACGCGTGFSGANSSSSVVGNISIGNTTNWGTTPTLCFLAYNGGLAGESWDNSASLFTISTADFIDYANYDFRPVNSFSPQVDLITIVDGDGLPRYDIAGAVRPNYINATTDKSDAGPFEFDHGNGLAPLQVTISITGMVSGSTLAIYKASDMSEIAAPATTTGSYSASYTYTGDTNIIVRVRKGTSGSKYLPYEYAGTITSTGFSLNVSQILDPIA